MPCRDEYPILDIYTNKQGQEIRTRLDVVTRAACDMRTILRRNGLENELCEETKEWIAAHDKWDEERTQEEKEDKIREKTRRKALAKLNVDERRALESIGKTQC